MRIVKLNKRGYHYFMKMRWILVSLLSLIVASCSESFEFKENLTPQGKPTAEELGFSNLKSQIFEPHCVSCHRGYTDYQSVRRELDLILLEVNSDRMPKWASPLSTSLKDLLHRWYQAGAPE